MPSCLPCPALPHSSAAVGVGGEYPLASSSAAERAEADPELRQRRGEMVVLTFSQQGWGEWPGLRLMHAMLVCDAEGCWVEVGWPPVTPPLACYWLGQVL